MSLAPAHAREKLECLIATECRMSYRLCNRVSYVLSPVQQSVLSPAQQCVLSPVQQSVLCLIACATNVYVGQAGEQDADDLAAADDDVRILCLNPNPKP